jgi:hypothetical protein
LLLLALRSPSENWSNPRRASFTHTSVLKYNYYCSAQLFCI